VKALNPLGLTVDFTGIRHTVFTNADPALVALSVAFTGEDMINRTRLSLDCQIRITARWQFKYLGGLRTRWNRSADKQES
jgi:hypothetical protein